MSVKTYVTTMPDKSGAFYKACKLIADEGGNITRVSYNKAVDLNMLFLDVDAAEDAHGRIHEALRGLGYLDHEQSDARVLVIELIIPDHAGAILPVLEILRHHEINISYMNSSATGEPFQRYKMGLFVGNAEEIEELLSEISKVYEVRILQYDDEGTSLDNTVFYFRLAEEMRGYLDLTQEQTTEFITASNRIWQYLQEQGEDPAKVFSFIKKFGKFISEHRGDEFRADVQKLPLPEDVMLWSIQPPCGSNTYVLEREDELVLIDTGYAIYRQELWDKLTQLFGSFEDKLSRVFITHADVDHCGMLKKLGKVPIVLNKKSAESLRRQLAGELDFREIKDSCTGYSMLSRIISGYEPPNPEQFVILDDGDTPEEHEALLQIGSFMFGPLEFLVYEGNGGHMYGEMIFVCPGAGVVFTGDNLVNISAFSEERARFNMLAPYLMGSVNLDSEKANQVRDAITEMVYWLEDQIDRPVIICGGHGPLSHFENGKLVKM